MSDRKPIRTKRRVAPRSFADSRAPTAARVPTGVRPHSRAPSAQFTKNTTSTESIAASIVGLMALAADSGPPDKVDTTNKDSLDVKAALAHLIAVRFDADD
jgi:phosphotransferase system HPr-like phosphotransfer protein